MKEEIEKKHTTVLGTNRAAEPLLTKTGRGVCRFHHNLSHGFYRAMSVKFLFFSSISRGILSGIYMTIEVSF